MERGKNRGKDTRIKGTVRRFNAHLIGNSEEEENSTVAICEKKEIKEVLN